MKNNSTQNQITYLLKRSGLTLWAMVALSITLIVPSLNGQVVSGELRKWHNVTITFDGPSVSESGTPNPFMDYRLNVTFTKGARTVVVPGYYAADGDAANSGATSGNKWRVHFAPDETGTWDYTASFRQGTNIAASTSPSAGTAVSFDGANGSIVILDTDKALPDLRAKGWLRYVNKPYPQFDNGEYFIRSGPGGPENFLGYSGFDNTPDNGYRHDYTPHVSDHDSADNALLWNGNGAGILGMVNYIAEQGMNSLYFITHTAGGDTKDTFPWTGPTSYSRYDVSKLAQWKIVFSQMTRKGIEMHLFFNEEENDLLINGGDLGNERKVYYREMVARFGHHLAVTWNLGEEINTTGGGRPSDAQIASYCSYIRSIDPYVHPIAAHCADSLTALYTPLLGNVNFEMATIQTTDNHSANGLDVLHDQIVDWRSQSTAAGRSWIVTNDEQGGWQTGLPTDVSDPWHPEYRKKALWGALMAGGGIAYYWNGDVNTEDIRPYEQMWQLSTYAVNFFQAYLPFPDMVNADSLTTASDDYVLAKTGEIYVIYLPNGGSTHLNLSGVSGTFNVQWFNPRNVANTSLTLETGSVSSVSGGGSVSIGNPPSSSSEDWVVIVGDTVSSSVPSIQSLELINATTDQVISTLTDGMTINFAVVGNQLNVNALVGGGTQSVNFNLDSGALDRTESTAPYALNGDTNGDFDPWTPSLGSHTLMVTPYAETGGAGSAGTPITIDFTVIDQAGSPPNAPSSLSASAVSSSQISLSWADNSSDENGFTIERNSGGGSFSQIAQVGSDVTSYSDTGLSASTSYSYRISAYNGFGTSAYSNEASATTSAPSGPEITHLNLINASTDQVISQMTDGMTINLAVVGSLLNVEAVPGSGVESVKFNLDGAFFRKENGAPYAMNGDDGAGDFYDWTPTLGSHVVEVIPYSLDNFGGTEGAAVTVNFTVINQAGGDTEAPSVPTGLVSSNVTSSSVDLSWSTSMDNVGVIGYNVYTNGANPVSVSGTSVTMSGLSASTSYTFTVSAYDAASNESAQSSGVNVTTQGGGDTEAPSVPTGLTSSNVTSSSVDLNWSASMDNVGVIGYNVYTNGADPVSVSGTSATISGLSASTSYTFTVSAYDAASNESAQSSGVNVTTQGGGGGTPGLLDQSQFSIYWVDSEETVGENAPATNTIDGNSNTFWHTKWQGGADPKPHEIQISLGGTFTVSALHYLPRQDAYLNGTVLNYEVYVSADGSNWTLVDSGTWANNHNEKVSSFNDVSGISYIALKDVGTASSWTTAAEINVVGLIGGADTQAPSVPTGLTASNVTSVTVDLDWNASSDDVGVTGYNVYTNGTSPVSVAEPSVTVSGLTPSTGYTFTVSAYDAASNESAQSNGVGVTTQSSGGGTPGVLDQTQFSIHYVDSEELVGENAPGTNIIDGNVSTFWHSKWYGGQDVKPHEIQIDLGGVFTVSELDYLPRQDAYLNGTILSYEVYVSSNGSSWALVDTGSWANNHDEKSATFSEQAGISYIRLRDVGTGNLTSGSEINIIGY